MSHYKHIQIFCNEDTETQLTNLINFPALTTESSYSKDDFLKTLKSGKIDAALLSAELADDEIVDKLHTRNVPLAVVLNPVDHDAIPKLLSQGVTTFLPLDGINGSLKNFLDSILLSTNKSDVLLKTLQRLRDLASSTSDGIIIFDDNKRLSFINKSAEKILGLTKAEAVRKGIDDIFKTHPFVLDCHDQKPYSVEDYTFVTSKDKEIVMSSTCSANYEEDKFAGAVLIFSKLSVNAMDKQKELELLKYQERYHSGQQNMAFKKQMLVLKDEMSNIIAGDLLLRPTLSHLIFLVEIFTAALILKTADTSFIS